MNTGDALFRAVCDATNLDGNCDDETAMAVLLDWVAENVSDRGLTLDDGFGMQVSFGVKDGEIGCVFWSDYGTDVWRREQSLATWLAQLIGFEFYLRTK